MIAHAGGLDEMLLALGLVVFVAVYYRRRNRSIPPPAQDRTARRCLYCGHLLGSSHKACPGSGFKDRGASARKRSDA